MNRILTLLLLSISINCFAQTQAEIDRDAYAEYDKAERNEVDQKKLMEYKNDTIFIADLEKSDGI